MLAVSVTPVDFPDPRLSKTRAANPRSANGYASTQYQSRSFVCEPWVKTTAGCGPGVDGRRSVPESLTSPFEKATASLVTSGTRFHSSVGFPWGSNVTRAGDTNVRTSSASETNVVSDVG